MLAHSTKQILTFGGRRCPYGLEIGARSTSELHIGIRPTAIPVTVEVQERHVTKLEVRTITAAASHVDESVDRPKRIDELFVCHSSTVTVECSSFGEWRARPRTTMPVNLLISPHHRRIVYGECCRTFQ
jgi:hypothetical protein